MKWNHKALLQQLRSVAFEKRIFVSFSIVLVVCTLAFTKFKNRLIVGGVLLKMLGFALPNAQTMTYAFVAGIMVVVSLWRMWAGSILTPKIMMRFKVQNERLVTLGPYRLVRNPIYLADLVAFLGFALVLPPIGLLMPLLLFVHYEFIIRHEEEALRATHGTLFEQYTQQVPRLLPRCKSLKNLPQVFKEFVLTLPGITHNALYLLFAPGFALSAVTRQLWPAILIGLPGVAAWTVLHLRLGNESPSFKKAHEAR